MKLVGKYAGEVLLRKLLENVVELQLGYSFGNKMPVKHFVVASVNGCSWRLL